MRDGLETTFPDHETVIVEGAGTYVESDEFVAAIRTWTATPLGDASRTDERHGS